MTMSAGCGPSCTTDAKVRGYDERDFFVDGNRRERLYNRAQQALQDSGVRGGGCGTGVPGRAGLLAVRARAHRHSSHGKRVRTRACSARDAHATSAPDSVPSLKYWGVAKR